MLHKVAMVNCRGHVLGRGALIEQTVSWATGEATQVLEKTEEAKNMACWGLASGYYAHPASHCSGTVTGPAYTGFFPTSTVPTPAPKDLRLQEVP